MIVEDRRNIQSGGLQSTQDFQIRANGHAFKILSSGLYSDKIRAILRELGCNAYDAHVSVGKGEVPFRIHLPDRLDPQLVIRDFGPGMSDQQIMTLYQTYFLSDKTDTNDLIGGLGLGSKSPFSYTDTYTVRSFQNGTMRTYAAYISDGGTPKISLLHTAETDEPDGMEIIIPVKKEDIYAFEDRARTVFTYFPVKPEIPNLSFHRVEYASEHSGWKIRKSGGYYDRQPNAIVGIVAYPLDISALPTATQMEKVILNMPIDVDFPVGSVEVAASREGLSYTPDTVRVIKAKIAKIAEELPKEFQAQIDACPTWWEARCKFREMVRESGISHDLQTALKSVLTYKGTLIEQSSLWFDRHAMSDFTVTLVDVRHQRRRKHWSLTNQHSQEEIPAHRNTWFVYDNEKTVRKQAILEHNMDGSVPIVIIRGNRDKALKWLGNPENVDNLHELPKPAIVATPRTRRRLKQIYEYRQGDWVETTYDVTKGGMYVDLYLFQPRNFLSFDTVHRTLTRLDLLKQPVYGIPATYKDIPHKNPGWTDFRTWSEQVAKELLTEHKYDQLVADRAELASASQDTKLVSLAYRLEGREFKRGPFRKLVQGVRKLTVDRELMKDLDRLAHSFGIDPAKKVKPSATLLDTLQKVYDKYPMLRVAEDHYNFPREDDLDTIYDYIQS